MITPIANLDISFPSTVGASRDDISNWTQALDHYTLPTSSTNDATDFPIVTSGGFFFTNGDISRNKIICIGNLLATGPLFYNMNTNSSEVPFSLTQGTGVTYSPYDDAFYIGGSTFLYRVYLSDTGSAVEVSTQSFRDQKGLSVGDKIYYGNRSTQGELDVRVYDIPTQTVIDLGSFPNAANQPTMANNGVIFYGTPQNTIYWYDTINQTSGSCSGTVDNDTAYLFTLHPDGYLYSMPSFNGTKVYKIDPEAKTVTVPYQGSPFTTTARNRSQWLGKDKNLYIQDGNTSNRLFVYNPYTNQAWINTQYTIPRGSTDRAYLGAVQDDEAVYLLPSTANHIKKFNIVPSQNLFDEKYYTSNFKREGN